MISLLRDLAEIIGWCVIGACIAAPVALLLYRLVEGDWGIHVEKGEGDIE